MAGSFFWLSAVALISVAGFVQESSASCLKCSGIGSPLIRKLSDCSCDGGCHPAETGYDVYTGTPSYLSCEHPYYEVHKHKQPYCGSDYTVDLAVRHPEYVPCPSVGYHVEVPPKVEEPCNAYGIYVAAPPPPPPVKCSAHNYKVETVPEVRESVNAYGIAVAVPKKKACICRPTVHKYHVESPEMKEEEQYAYGIAVQRYHVPTCLPCHEEPLCPEGELPDPLPPTKPCADHYVLPPKHVHVEVPSCSCGSCGKCTDVAAGGYLYADSGHHSRDYDEEHYDSCSRYDQGPQRPYYHGTTLQCDNFPYRKYYSASSEKPHGSHRVVYGSGASLGVSNSGYDDGETAYTVTEERGKYAKFPKYASCETQIESPLSVSYSASPYHSSSAYHHKYGPEASSSAYDSTGLHIVNLGSYERGKVCEKGHPIRYYKEKVSSYGQDYGTSSHYGGSGKSVVYEKSEKKVDYTNDYGGTEEIVVERGPYREKQAMIEEKIYKVKSGEVEGDYGGGTDKYVEVVTSHKREGKEGEYDYETPETTKTKITEGGDDYGSKKIVVTEEEREEYGEEEAKEVVEEKTKENGGERNYESYGEERVEEYAPRGVEECHSKGCSKERVDAESEYEAQETDYKEQDSSYNNVRQKEGKYEENDGKYKSSEKKCGGKSTERPYAMTGGKPKSILKYSMEHVEYSPKQYVHGEYIAKPPCSIPPKLYSSEAEVTVTKFKIPYEVAAVTTVSGITGSSERPLCQEQGYGSSQQNYGERYNKKDYTPCGIATSITRVEKLKKALTDDSEEVEYRSKENYGSANRNYAYSGQVDNVEKRSKDYYGNQDYKENDYVKPHYDDSYKKYNGPMKENTEYESMNYGSHTGKVSYANDYGTSNKYSIDDKYEEVDKKEYQKEITVTTKKYSGENEDNYNDNGNCGKAPCNKKKEYSKKYRGRGDEEEEEKKYEKTAKNKYSDGIDYEKRKGNKYGNKPYYKKKGSSENIYPNGEYEGVKGKAERKYGMETKDDYDNGGNYGDEYERREGSKYVYNKKGSKEIYEEDGYDEVKTKEYDEEDKEYEKTRTVMKKKKKMYVKESKDGSNDGYGEIEYGKDDYDKSTGYGGYERDGKKVEKAKKKYMDDNGVYDEDEYKYPKKGYGENYQDGGYGEGKQKKKLIATKKEYSQDDSDIYGDNMYANKKYSAKKGSKENYQEADYEGNYGEKVTATKKYYSGEKKDLYGNDGYAENRYGTSTQYVDKTYGDYPESYGSEGKQYGGEMSYGQDKKSKYVYPAVSKKFAKTKTYKGSGEYNGNEYNGNGNGDSLYSTMTGGHIKGDVYYDPYSSAHPRGYTNSHGKKYAKNKGYHQVNQYSGGSMKAYLNEHMGYGASNYASGNVNRLVMQGNGYRDLSQYGYGNSGYKKVHQSEGYNSAYGKQNPYP